VAFFRIGGPGKAAQIPEEGQESKVSARNSTRSESRHQMLGKKPLTKKAREKSLTSIEQSLMAGPNCQAGRGKDGAAPSLGEQWLFRRGRVRKLVQVQWSLAEVGLS
jgi:hypothetical protein